MPDLPGVEVLGQVSDPPGREGVGVMFPGTDRTPLGSTRQRLVVDPSTGTVLSERQVLIAPSARVRAAGPDADAAPDHRAAARMSRGEHRVTGLKDARRRFGGGRRRGAFVGDRLRGQPYATGAGLSPRSAGQQPRWES